MEKRKRKNCDMQIVKLCKFFDICRCDDVVLELVNLMSCFGEISLSIQITYQKFTILFSQFVYIRHTIWPELRHLFRHMQMFEL